MTGEENGNAPLATAGGTKTDLNPSPQSSILRQIVAGPRLQHPEANLDLCYVTDNSMFIDLNTCGKDSQS
jgi:hypothetical protein